MGPRVSSLLAVLMIVLAAWVSCFSAQPINSARRLDALLQDYAFQAFKHPKTGVLYSAAVPSNLTGVSVAAMRLRSGSFRKRGVVIREFNISSGVVVKPYVERIILVYQNLGDLSQQYYPLPGYTYLAPVLGLLVYNASNLSATNLPELDFRATLGPVNISFVNLKPAPDGSIAKCVWFDLHGLTNFTNLTAGSSCTTTQQGHFSVVVESMAPSPAPVSILVPPTSEGKKSNSRVWIIVGSVLGGFLLLVLLSFLVLWAHKLKQRQKMRQMEREAEVGEALHMASVGETKAPAATVTRTQPMLESEYVP